MRDIRLICRKCGRSFKTDRGGAIDIIQDEGCCDSCGGALYSVDPLTGGEMDYGEWPDDPDHPREVWEADRDAGRTQKDYEEWLEHEYEAEDALALPCEVGGCDEIAAPCPCGCAHCPTHPHVDVSPNKGRAVPKTCPRCGATSTGGRYCPRGCGAI